MAKPGHKGNGHGQMRETPDVSHIKNLDVTHELSDVNVGGILKFVLGLTVLTVTVFVLMWALFKFYSMQAAKEPEPGPMALSKDERLPPEPRLQAARGFGIKLENGQWVSLELRQPEAEYRVLRDQWLQALQGKDPSGKALLPIDQAIEEVVKGNQLPVRPNARDQVDPVIALPTAASSGRVAAKSR